MLVAVLGLIGYGVYRADGFSAIDATSPHSTRWFADSTSDRVVLMDGYTGRALARLEGGDETQIDDVVQGGGQATLIDRTARSLRVIDGTELKLGPSQPLPILAEPAIIAGMTANGLVVVDPVADQARVVPSGGTPVSLDVVADLSASRTRIAPDGAIWTLVTGELRRTTANGSAVVASDLQSAEFTLVGETPLVVDRSARRVRLGGGDWVQVPDDFQLDDLVIQQSSPRAECGWIGVGTSLMCVGEGGIVYDREIPGLDIRDGDLLAIAGDAGAVIDRTTGTISRINWLDGEVVEEIQTVGSDPVNLRVQTGPNLVWIDAPLDPLVWAVNPWGVTQIRKDDSSTPLLGDEGEVLEEGDATGGDVTAIADEGAAEERDPDDNDVDDPPVAVDDAVSARAGSPVPINVTANDYDPDGEAIALVSVTSPSSGTTSVSSATTVSYQAAPGYTGTDQFEYTIVDGNGTEASATVTVDLLSSDATNQAPFGSPDVAQTGPGRAVIVDVLINDVDPERDALRINSFQSDVEAGQVEEVTAPSGLPGLRFTPARGFSGDATFSYTPVDSYGAVGDPVDVTVEVAPPGTRNRPPIAKPDAVRVRRGERAEVAALANDTDPDGDSLTLELVEPIPDGLDVSVQGTRLVIIARAGAARLIPMTYIVRDSQGLEAIGSVLVSVVDEDEPNLPPIANADAATAVFGDVAVIDVLANDTDPDNDPLAIVEVSPTSEGGTVSIDGDRVLYTPGGVVDDEPVLDRFTYVVSDTDGNEAEGVVSVKVIPEELPEPPVALDDSVNTDRDVPIVIDVLNNDTDPSGRPLSISGRPGCASGGTAEVTQDQLVRYTPPDGASGVFSCTYEVVNNANLRASATITISVVSPPLSNRPPTVVGEEVSVRVNESVTVDVLANDSDPDGDDASLVLLNSTAPARGTATRDDAAGTITFQAPPDPTVVSISYDVVDAAGEIARGRLVIRVNAPEAVPPVAGPDFRSTQAPAGTLTVDVLANDADPDGDSNSLSITNVSVRSGAASASIGERQLVVSIDRNFVGEILVDYEITDSDDLRATGRLTIQVVGAPVNRPPIAVDDSANVVAGESVEVSIALNDSDPDGDPLTFAITEQPDPALGTATLAGGTVTFTALLAAKGQANIGYSVSDGETAAAATLRVDIAECVAEKPEAVSTTINTGYHTPIEIDLNDFAKNGEVVDVSGAISSVKETYTPPEGENGEVSVNFSVVNKCGGRDTGTLTIDVNQTPIATPTTVEMPRRSSREVSVDELASDDGPLVIVGLYDAPDWVSIDSSQRKLLINPNGVTGKFAFGAVVEDEGGLQNEVRVDLVIRNTAPVANSDSVTATETVIEIAPIANDTDADGDTLRLLAVDETADFGDRLVKVKQLDDQRVQLDLTGVEGEGTFYYSVDDDAGAASELAVVRIVTKWGKPKVQDVTAEVGVGGETIVKLPVSHPQGLPLTVGVVGATPEGVQVVIDGTTMTISASESAVPATYDVGYQATTPGGLTATASVALTVVAATESAP